MPFNLWILPLLSGFFFLRRFHYARHKTQRYAYHTIVLYSVAYGIVIFFLAYLVRLIVSVLWPSLVSNIYDIFYSFYSYPEPLLLTSISSLFLTVGFVYIVNSILKFNNYFNWSKPVEKAIDAIGTEVEVLFKESCLEKQLIQITLKNNKVYVGFASRIFPPKESGDYLRIIPLISGYRNPTSKEICFTTDYLGALNIYMEDEEKWKSFDMDVLVMQSEIITAQIFDEDIYNAFNNNGSASLSEPKEKRPENAVKKIRKK